MTLASVDWLDSGLNDAVAISTVALKLSGVSNLSARAPLVLRNGGLSAVACLETSAGDWVSSLDAAA